ncbi:hypothetical protein BGZ73_002597 [Actinomortierella ambigua]|nr:hypothetical protein BGZ73_002597 [Actinomortierella ambigua]
MPLTRTVSSLSNLNNMHLGLENPASSPSSSPKRLNTLQTTSSRSSHHPSPGSPSSTSSPAHTRTRSPPLATTAATTATVTTFSSLNVSPLANSATNTLKKPPTTYSYCQQQQERDQECPDSTIALSRLLEHRLNKGSPALPLLTISTPPTPLPIASGPQHSKDNNQSDNNHHNHINSAGTSCSPSPPALILSSASSPSSASSSNASSPCSLTDSSEIPSPATPLSNIPFLLSQPIMPMSVIPAAIMGAKAVSPCVALGNIFNLKSHPASPTAAACLLPLVGKDYLSYGNLNALATGKISAETKPRPLSSMEYAEAWLPSSDVPAQTVTTTDGPSSSARVSEQMAMELQSVTKELPKIPPSDGEETSQSHGTTTTATSTTNVLTSTENYAVSTTLAPSSLTASSCLPTSTNDQLPIHPLELAPDTSPLLTASFSQFLAGGEFVDAEEPTGPLSLPIPQKSSSLPPLPVANETAQQQQHPLDSQGSTSCALPPLPTNIAAAATGLSTASTTIPTTSPGISLAPTSLSVPSDQSPIRRHSEPGPTTSSKAGQEPAPLPHNSAARVIRKKTSFASKLRKVFIIKPAQSNKAEGEEGRQNQPPSTPQLEQLRQLQQEQHRGSVSSSSSGDTAIGFSEGTTTIATTTAEAQGRSEDGEPRSREGSASSQPYTPVTSPEMSPTGSPKFQLVPSASSPLPVGSGSLSRGESNMESSGTTSIGTSSSEMVLETTPTRAVKKRLSFASISSFFQPRNNGSPGASSSSSSSSSSSNNSEDSVGAREGTASASSGGVMTAGRSEEQQQKQQDEGKSKKKTKQQRSSSVPNVEHPLSIVGRQLAGFQRRHSLNDLHGNGKTKEQEEVDKQNLDLQRKTVTAHACTHAGASADVISQSATEASPMASHDSGKDDGVSSSSGNPHGTKRTFNVFQASFSSLSRKNKLQQQSSQQVQKQKQTRPAQPLRSALRRLPPPPALEALQGTAGASADSAVVNGASDQGDSGNVLPTADGRTRRSPSIQSHSSARGGAGGRRHGSVSYSSASVQAATNHHHQYPHHNTLQHRHSEPTMARQTNGANSTASPRSSGNGHHLSVDDSSVSPRPRLSFIQVDDQNENGYLYCTSPLQAADSEGTPSSGYTYTMQATNCDTGSEGMTISNGQPTQVLVMPTSTTPQRSYGMQNGGGEAGNMRQPDVSCCSFLSETSDEGSMHDVASGEDEDDDAEDEAEVARVGLKEDDGSRRRRDGPVIKATTVTAGRRSKKRHHVSRQQHLQQQQQNHHAATAHPPQSPPQHHQQYHTATSAAGSDQYRSVLPTNAARISVDRIVMEQDGGVVGEHDDLHHADAYVQQHQDIVMTSPTSSRVDSHGGDHQYHAGEYTYDPYSTSYAYDAVQMQLPSQHLVYQLEQQPYASSSSTGSSTSSTSTYTSSYPSAAYIDGSIYQHPAYLHQHLLSMPSPQQTADATTATAVRQVRQIQFSTDEPMIHPTWTAEQYDRTSDANITALRLTPAIAQKIKLELNLFKSQEMAVHQDSRIYTHFFV